MSQLVFEAFATDGKAVEAEGKARECKHSGEAPLAQASHHDLSQGRGWNFPGVDVWSEERGPVANAWKGDRKRWGRMKRNNSRSRRGPGEGSIKGAAYDFP